MPHQPPPTPAQLLDDTIRWCAGRADPAEPARCLRDVRHVPWWFGGRPVEIVEHFLSGRRSLARATGASAATGARGRLLACLPHLQLADGAPEAESRGFFDVYNTPPWDGWVAYEAAADGSWDLLVAWVPEVLVPFADDGVQVCCDESLEWLEAPEAVRVPGLRARLRVWAELAR
jgi:hypothetical protein